MELYTVAGQRWTYTCLYCLLLYRYCTHYRCESTLAIETLLWILLESLLESLLERAALRKE